MLFSIAETEMPFNVVGCDENQLTSSQRSFFVGVLFKSITFSGPVRFFGIVDAGDVLADVAGNGQHEEGQEHGRQEVLHLQPELICNNKN